MRKIATLLFMGPLLLSAIGFAYNNPELINIPLLFEKLKNEIQTDREVYFDVVSDVNEDSILKIGIILVCEDRKQQKSLEKQLSQIKSDFLLSVNKAEMDGWVRDRNFDAMKKRLTEIVNRCSDTTIKGIYLDSFNY